MTSIEIEYVCPICDGVHINRTTTFLTNETAILRRTAMLSGYDICINCNYRGEQSRMSRVSIILNRDK